MQAGIYFTGSGPLLVLTTYASLDDPNLVDKLEAKGIKKFIAYRVPEETVRRVYGPSYEMVMGDVSQTDDLRVLDFNGHHIFYNFCFRELGEPIYHEPEKAAA